MSRVYWDTMLFIYLLENNRQFNPRVEAIFDRMLDRGDSLYTSYLSLGEVLAGAQDSAQKANTIRTAFS